MGEQYRPAGELGEHADDLVDTGSRGHHLVSDASQALDGGGNGLRGADEKAQRIDDLAALDARGPDLDDR